MADENTTNQDVAQLQAQNAELSNEIKKIQKQLSADENNVKEGDTKAQKDKVQTSSALEFKQLKVEQWPENSEHENPMARPQKGTLDQETVDTTIKTIRGMRLNIENFKSILKIDEVEALIAAINRTSSLLSKISSSDFTNKLSDEEILGLCENKVLVSTISSAEIIELKASLQTLDIEEIKKTLERIIEYLKSRLEEILKNSFGGFSDGSNETTADLEELKKALSDLFFGGADGNIAEKVAAIIKYLKKLSEALFEGPVGRIIFLILWYGEYFGRVGNELNQLADAIRQGLNLTTKFSTTLNLNMVKFTELKTMIENIDKVLEMNDQTLNNSNIRMQEMNETIFSERSLVNSLEDREVQIEKLDKRNDLSNKQLADFIKKIHF